MLIRVECFICHSQRKQRRRRLNKTKHFEFPIIYSPNHGNMNSLMNLTKAKIYGISIENFPQLKKEKDRYGLTVTDI